MLNPTRRSSVTALAVTALLAVGAGPVAAAGAQASRPKPPKACHSPSFSSRHKRLCHPR